MESQESGSVTEGARFTVCKAENEESKITSNKAVESPLNDGIN